MLALAIAVPAAGGAPSITVDPGKVLGKVPRLVFGHNVEAADTQFIFSGPRSNPMMGRTGDGLWDPTRRRPVPEALALSKEIRLAMLRYPGGCLTHNFNWKKAVGPVEDRPNFTFGVDEYLAWCRAAGAEPLMNVSAYVGGPAEAAQLVEYLNGPADDKHPWAQKRARWGHREPYGVTYFEMGNESDHGNHDVKPFRKHTPADYATWFNDCADRMRAVDPTIRIGAHMGTGTGPDDPWNAVVLARTKGRADFIIVHTYAVGLWDPRGANSVAQNADLLMRACMAAGEQTEVLLGRYREAIRRHAGKDLPLAITEYNASFVQDKPVPYRYSLGAALFSADYVRILLKGDSHVLMANYWHLVNGYWGMLRGPRRPGEKGSWTKRPAWYLYRLWGQHFGSRLVSVGVETPRLEFEGVLRVRPARKANPAAAVGPLTITAAGGTGTGYTWKRTGPRALTATLTACRNETYHTLGTAPAGPGQTVRIAHEGRVVAGKLAGARLGVDLIDARGWAATRSGCATQGIEGAGRWRSFDAQFVTTPGCKALTAHLRLIAKGTGGVTGAFEIRNLRVERVADAPPYAALTACASLSQDGRALYVIVFNKHHAEAIAADVRIADGSGGDARAWTVTGPSLAATNLKAQEVRETITARPVAGAAAGGFRYTFPARSMTALEIARRPGPGDAPRRTPGPQTSGR